MSSLSFSSIAVTTQRNCILPPTAPEYLKQVHSHSIPLFANKESGLNCFEVQSQDGYVSIRMTDRTRVTRENLDGFVSAVSTDGDNLLKKVFWNIRKVSNFYKEVFHYPLSPSSQNKTFRAVIHEGNGLVNTYWNPQDQTIHFGDGDAVYRNLPERLDVTAHELTHGLLDSFLPCEGETGTINEHLCDVMGILIRFYDENKHSPIDEDWVIAKNFVEGRFPLRSFVNPGEAYDKCSIYQYRDAQVAHYAHRSMDASVNGGVHVNSGILNRAFYLFWKRIQPRGGAPWQMAGTVWFQTIAHIKNGGQCKSMREFANLTVQAAVPLQDPILAASLKDAWREVGVL